MTKKFRENFFILLSSNICTIGCIVILPWIFNGQIFLGQEEESMIKVDSITGIIYCIFCMLVVCLFWSFHKGQNNTEIVINNHVTPVQSINYTLEKADDIREKHRQICEEEKHARMKAVIEYTYKTLSPFITDENLDILCQNIKLFEVPGSCLTSIVTNSKLTTLDIKHYGWNIGERLGWSGQQRATFIKLCFVKELSGIEIETIRRTFRQKGKCIIDIDIPNKNNYEFH